MRYAAAAEVRRTDVMVPLSGTATPAEIRQAYEDVAEEWAEAMGADAPESWVAWTIEEDGELFYLRVKIAPPEGSSEPGWDLDTGKPSAG